MRKDDKMQIVGKHCIFDYSLSPAQEALAKEATKYIDKRAIPFLYSTLNIPIPVNNLRVLFEDIGSYTACYVWPDDVMKINPKYFKRNDLGVLIHECVHRTQYTSDMNAVKQRETIYEAVADYYRIVLSEDKKGDYYSDEKSRLVETFDKEEQWNSLSEFVAHLRRLSRNENFVKELNDALRLNNVAFIDSFFVSRFNGQGWGKLLENYAKNRDQILKAKPETINRYQYFTEMD